MLDFLLTRVFRVENLIYILPAVTLTALGAMFISFRRASATLIKPARRRTLTLHKCTRRDALIALVITLVYGGVAFLNLGNSIAPQTFHRFMHSSPSVTINLGRDLEISKIVYYTGSFHQKDKDTPCYTLTAASSADATLQAAGKMSQTHGGTFHWQTVTPKYDSTPDEPFVASTLRITTSVYPIELGELALYSPDGTLYDASDFTVSSPENLLFDEQQCVPEVIDYMSSMYFDEIYHARTAREFLLSDRPYENTHPPLGKVIIAAGIALFGMTPLGWRIPGVIFGILMLPFFYVFVKNMFGKTWLAACATLIFAFDFMHFTQTRIATIDTYGVFFTILMFFFMYRYMAAGYAAKWHKQLIPLALAGISFGLGAASKWTCIYAGGGILVLYVIYNISVWARRRRDIRSGGTAVSFYPRFFASILVCGVFFLAVSAVIYYFSYYFFARGLGQELNFEVVWDNQVTMWKYHSVLVATHPYQSSWYQWIVNGRPILYYSSSGETTRKAFAAFLNPVLCWGGLMAVIALFTSRYRDVSRRIKTTAYALAGIVFACTVFIILIDQSTAYEEPVTQLAFFAELPASLFTSLALAVITGILALFALPALSRTAPPSDDYPYFIVVGYLAQFLPWIAVSRCTFNYHYFPATPFLVLALAWVFDRWDSAPRSATALPRSSNGRPPSFWALATPGKRAAFGFTAACLAVFALFYPVIAGTQVPLWYRTFVTHWLPSWPI